MSRKSSFAASTLTVTLKESLTLDGRDYGGSQSYSFSSIGNVTRKIETISTTESVVMTLSTIVGAGRYVAANIKYLRFTNLDDTNFITLTFRNQDNDEVAIKLDAGLSMVWNGDNSGGMAGVMNATEDADAASSTNLGSLTNIQADADTASCDMEIFIAGS